MDRVEAGITVTLPKPMTSGNHEDLCICLAGERLKHDYTNDQKRLRLRRYWTNACRACTIKPQCTRGEELGIPPNDAQGW